MTSQQDDRLRVWLACRPIFSGENARLRKGKKVKRLISERKSSLGPLLKTIKEERLLNIVDSLLDKRVFESEEQAKAEFPDFFRTQASRDAQRRVSEVKASRPAAEVLDEKAPEFQVSDEAVDQRSDDPGVKQGGVADEQKAEPRATTDSGVPPGQSSISAKRDRDTGIDHSHVPRAKSPLRNMPSLYPCYLPYKTQHSILTMAQQALEECCFEFAAKNLPAVLEDKGWDCPEAVELTRWLPILQDKSVTTDVQPYFANVDAEGLKALFADVSRLRNSAVHREPVTAKGVSQLLESAVKLSQILQDDRRSALLDDVRKELKSKIRAMERNKTALEDTFIAGLLDIQRQREELDRKEMELIEGTVKGDQQNKAYVGKLLEEHVLRIFGKGKCILAPHGPEEQGVYYKAQRTRLEQSLQTDHGVGVNGLQESYLSDTGYDYDDLEKITRGVWLYSVD
ncbi:hypothetical protein VUR80DRAFT_5689 [Thermomyces stellatus]